MDDSHADCGDLNLGCIGLFMYEMYLGGTWGYIFRRVSIFEFV